MVFFTMNAKLMQDYNVFSFREMRIRVRDIIICHQISFLPFL